MGGVEVLRRDRVGTKQGDGERLMNLSECVQYLDIEPAIGTIVQRACLAMSRVQYASADARHFISIRGRNLTKSNASLLKWAAAETNGVRHRVFISNSFTSSNVLEFLVQYL